MLDEFGWSLLYVDSWVSCLQRLDVLLTGLGEFSTGVG